MAESGAADVLGGTAAQAPGGEARPARPLAVDLPEQGGRGGIEHEDRPLWPFDRDGACRRAVARDLLAAPHRDVVHESSGGEIDLVARLGSARMADAEHVL